MRTRHDWINRHPIDGLSSHPTIHSVVIKRSSTIKTPYQEVNTDSIGKTAIRTILGPQYAKIKKAPKVVDEDEAKVLLSKILPK
jgi:hypothetical protein